MVEIHKYKIDIESDGNVIPTRMYKVLFQQTNISELKKSLKGKIMFHAYNNLCILQIGICRVAFINKVTFYILPGNRSALLGMPDCEYLQLLSINHQMANDMHNRRQSNEQTK